MKKLFLFFIILYLSLNCKSQSVNIQMDLHSFPDQTFYLASYYGDKFQILDTINSKDGKFSIIRDKLFPQGVYTISGKNKYKYFELLLSKDQIFSVTTNFKSIIDSLKFKGSIENQNFTKYLKYSSLKNKQNQSLKKLIKISQGQENLNFVKQQNQLYADIKNYRLQEIQKNPNSLLSALFSMMREHETPKELKRLPRKKYNNYVAHYWDYIDLNDERLIRTPILDSKVSTFFNKVLVQHPDSIIRNIDILFSKTLHPEIYSYLLLKLSLNYEYPKIMGLDKVFVHIIDKYFTKDQIALSKTIKDALIERVKKIRPLLIGQKAPDLIMIDTLNQFKSFYSITNKYTVIFFWDHDCQSCQKELNLLKNIYNKKIYDIEIFAVETTAELNKWKDFIHNNELNWINVNVTQSISADFHDLYDIYSTPTIYILDQKKRIIAKRIAAKNILFFLRNFETRK